VNSPGRGLQLSPGGVENESGRGLPQSKALSREKKGNRTHGPVSFEA
jgi:hypothetical protein